jgi:hypothetical protein
MQLVWGTVLEVRTSRPEHFGRKMLTAEQSLRPERPCRKRKYHFNTEIAAQISSFPLTNADLTNITYRGSAR